MCTLNVFKSHESVGVVNIGVAVVDAKETWGKVLDQEQAEDGLSRSGQWMEWDGMTGESYQEDQRQKLMKLWSCDRQGVG